MAHEVAAALRKGFRERGERREVPVRHGFPQEWPRAFGRLKLRGVRRQADNPDVFRNDDAFFRMEPRSIHRNDGDGSGLRELPGFREFPERDRCDPVRDGREQEKFAFAVLRAEESENVFPFVPGAVLRERTVASFRPPDPPCHGLEPNPCFVFRPDFHFLPGIFRYGFRVRFREFFLKPSRSSAVALFSCAGRGTWSEKPMAFR